MHRDVTAVECDILFAKPVTTCGGCGAASKSARAGTSTSVGARTRGLVIAVSGFAGAVSRRSNKIALVVADEEINCSTRDRPCLLADSCLTLLSIIFPISHHVMAQAYE